MLCDDNKSYTAYGEIKPSNSSKPVLIQIKNKDGTDSKNKPSRLRAAIRGDKNDSGQPIYKEKAPIIYNGVTYVPDLEAMNNSNCPKSFFSSDKMIFPYKPSSAMGGRKKMRSSRKKTKRSRGKRTKRRRTMKKY